MKPQFINQEILIFTGTSFAHRELNDREENKKCLNLSSLDKLEKACWDGMLEDLLPEIWQDVPKKELFIRQIVAADNYLCVNMGMFDKSVLQEYSIDPYFFVPVTFLN